MIGGEELAMSHETGESIAGRYRLDERIASGGMGEVWRATDTVLNRPVAVKTLRPDRAGDPQFQSRFRNEARAMAALHHPGVVDVYDFGQEPGADAYLVMARVDGEPLDLRIAVEGRLSTTVTMTIVAQVARALQAVHDAGIVHRDVKPGNLIIQPDGTVVLVDFGIARSADSADVTGAREVVGTAGYIAPEQVSKQHVGPAADVYALGAVAYHCLAGHPPFLGDNPITVAMQHVRDVPPPLPGDVGVRARELVATALAKSPTDRFRSAGAMAAAAEAAAGTSDTTLSLPVAEPLRTGYSVPPAVPPARARHPYLLAVLAAVLMLLAAGAAIATTDPFGWFPGPVPPSASVSTTPVTRSPTPSTPGTTRPTTTSKSPAPSPSRTSASPGPTGSPTPSRSPSPSSSPSPRPSSPSPASPTASRASELS
jgi:serine/threonine protein kinase